MLEMVQGTSHGAMHIVTLETWFLYERELYSVGSVIYCYFTYLPNSFSMDFEYIEHLLCGCMIFTTTDSCINLFWLKK